MQSALDADLERVASSQDKDMISITAFFDMDEHKTPPGN